MEIIEGYGFTTKAIVAEYSVTLYNQILRFDKYILDLTKVKDIEPEERKIYYRVKINYVINNKKEKYTMDFETQKNMESMFEYIKQIVLY